MKKTLKQLLTIILVVTMVLGGVKFTVDASSINSAKKKVTQLENKKKEIQNKIKNLEKEKGDILNYIEKLDRQLEELSDSIRETEGEIETTEQDLEVKRQELEAAQEEQDNQYATMKKRIQYTYENGGTDYMDILLSADNLSDLLNRTEYIEKISEYDNNMLERYIAAREDVEQKKLTLENKLADLETLKEELTIEQDSVNQLVDAKNAEVEKYSQKIKDAEGQASDYEDQIKKQEELVEKLLEEERKRVEAERKKNEGSYNFDASSGFRWPLNVRGTITCGFGPRKSPTAGASSYHQGIDIGVPTGTPIVAAVNGTVTTASYSSAAGNYVMIYHGDSKYTVYMHCSRLAVSKGQTVSQGQVIAYAGSTGISTGPHLHFGISINGGYKNPLNYVKQ
ncbi:murein hydrolase activator EnvC family protein [Anaerolentibacter hominis]|uniref:murein hydrolase activator EnvC family protein n=1 Tax=Anaerolentibacter hominis TaxID=3079009 RepID=UPI0031B7EEE2